MTQIELVLSVIGLFMLRIGLPLLLLIALGTIIDRWQRKQHEEARHQREQQAH